MAKYLIPKPPTQQQNQCRLLLLLLLLRLLRLQLKIAHLAKPGEEAEDAANPLVEYQYEHCILYKGLRHTSEAPCKWASAGYPERHKQNP